MKTNWGKDLSIETLRGVAIILMVAGHVVGAEANDAMQVSDESPWRFIFWGLQDFRMPLFTVLSGFVYAARPAREWPQYGSLVKGKVIRVLVPLATVGTLVFLAKLINPSSSSGVGPSDWWKVYFFGWDHLWFLQAIFLIFLIAGILDVLGVMINRSGWLAVTAISAAIYMSTLVPSVALLGISPAIKLLPFFLLGYGLKRFGLALSRVWVGMLGIVLVAAFTPRILALNEVITISDARIDRALAMVIGVSALLILFHFRQALTNQWIARLGGYAFGIYLFHYFALQAVWIGSRAIGMDNEVLKFTLGLTLGLGMPIILYIVTGRSRWARLFLFGEKLTPRKERARVAA